MAWHNLNNTDPVPKEFSKQKRIERCGFLWSGKRNKNS